MVRVDSDGFVVVHEALTGEPLMLAQCCSSGVC
jgi:hypothetical protein